MRRVQDAWTAAKPYLPGIAVFSAIYLWVALRGQFDASAPEALWQSVGRRALVQEPFRSLWSLHIQPPGLNALYMVAFNSGHPTLVLQPIFFLAGAATVVLVVDTLRHTGVATGPAAGSGVVYAALPSTALYTLYPYNTTLVAFLLMLMVWAFERVTRRRAASATIVVAAALGLFMIRPSFVWPFAALCMFLPLVAVPRQRPRQLWTLAAAGALVVFAVQAHYVVEFGLPTTSSWTGENLVKGLVGSGAVSPAELTDAAAGDPCLESLARVVPFFYDASQIDLRCFGAHDDLRGTAIALDDTRKADGVMVQFNNVTRLEASASWNRLARRVVLRHPLAVVRMALGPGHGPSSFELMLRPGHDYPFLAENLRTGAPVTTVLRPLGAVFPGASLALVTLAMLRLRRRHLRVHPTARVVALTGALVLYTVAMGVIVEWGENMRFLTEAYPLLLCGAVWAVAAPLRDASLGERGGELGEESGTEAG